MTTVVREPRAHVRPDPASAMYAPIVSVMSGYWPVATDIASQANVGFRGADSTDQRNTF